MEKEKKDVKTTVKRIIEMLIVTAIISPIFVNSVRAYTYYSENGATVSTNVETLPPLYLVGEYTFPHVLKLGVWSALPGESGTARGSMLVFGKATYSGWVTGTLKWYMRGLLLCSLQGYEGGLKAWITVKFQAIDVTASSMVEKVVFHKEQKYGYTILDGEYSETMDIPLYDGHLYEFVLDVEVHAENYHPVLSDAKADFAGFYFSDSRIEWRFIDVPNVTPDIGTGGCPILYVWNGSEYVCEGLLYIHNPSGVDVITIHTLISTPQRVNGVYILRLVEHPQTHSYVDQVKLYAILEDGTTIQLPLKWAWHSECGNVLPQLLFSDDVRTDTLGANLNNGTSQSIDLRFQALPPNLNARGFIFQIEGHNINYKL